MIGSLNKNSIKHMLAAHGMRLIISSLVPLVTLPYAARVLGPSSIGLYQFTFTIMTNFLILGALGLPTYGQREIAAARHLPGNLESRATNLYLLGAIAATIAYLFLILFAYLSPALRANFFLISVLGLIIPFTALAADWIFFGLDDYVYISLRTSILQIISAFGIFAFVHTQGDLNIYAALMVFPYVFGYIFNIKRLTTLLSTNLLEPKVILRDLMGTSTLLISSFAISVYTNLDTVILGMSGTNSEVGFYALAKKLVLAGIAFSTALGTVLSSRLANYHAIGNDSAANYLLKVSFRFLLYLALPCSIGLSFLSKEIVLLFGGTAFVEAQHSLQILAPNIFIVTLAQIAFLQILIPKRMEAKALVAWISGAIVGLTVGIFTIPKYGQIGAAITCLVSEITATCFALYFARNTLLKATRGMEMLTSIFSAILMSFVLHRYRIRFPENIFFQLSEYVLVGAASYFILPAIFFLVWRPKEAKNVVGHRTFIE